jgi:hypothetical protein
MLAYIELTRFSTITSKAKYCLTHKGDRWEISAWNKAEAGAIARDLLDTKAGLIGQTDFEYVYSNRIEFLWGSAHKTSAIEVDLGDLRKSA